MWVNTCACMCVCGLRIASGLRITWDKTRHGTSESAIGVLRNAHGSLGMCKREPGKILQGASRRIRPPLPLLVGTAVWTVGTVVGSVVGTAAFLYVPCDLIFRILDSWHLKCKISGTYKNTAVPTTEPTAVPTVHTAVPRNDICKYWLSARAQLLFTFLPRGLALPVYLLKGLAPASALLAQGLGAHFNLFLDKYLLWLTRRLELQQFACAAWSFCYFLVRLCSSVCQLENIKCDLRMSPR